MNLKYFRRAWGNCPYPIQIVTNTNRVDHENVVYLGEDMGWSNNLLKYLESVDEPFIPWFDDYFLMEVDAPVVAKAVSLVKTGVAGMVRLYPCPGPDFPYNDVFGEIDKDDMYSASLQAAVWNPRVMRDLLRKGETAWDFEIHGSKRARSHPAKFLSAHKTAMSYQNYLRQGEIVESVAEWVGQNP